MTCGETLAFYAAVILSATAEQRRQQVQEVLREMGLGASSSTLVGVATITEPRLGVARRGGGGEQRRQQVQEVLREMGLGASSNTLVGICYNLSLIHISQGIVR